MEVNKDKLIEVLTNMNNSLIGLTKRLETIERLLNNNPDKNTNPVPTKITNTKTILKNTIDWDNLIYSISDTNQKNIVNQIYENKYPTITEGQYNMIKNIATQNNFQL